MEQKHKNWIGFGILAIVVLSLIGRSGGWIFLLVVGIIIFVIVRQYREEKRKSVDWQRPPVYLPPQQDEQSQQQAVQPVPPVVQSPNQPAQSQENTPPASGPGRAVETARQQQAGQLAGALQQYAATAQNQPQPGPGGQYGFEPNAQRDDFFDAPRTQQVDVPAQRSTLWEQEATPSEQPVATAVPVASFTDGDALPGAPVRPAAVQRPEEPRRPESMPPPQPENPLDTQTDWPQKDDFWARQEKDSFWNQPTDKTPWDDSDNEK